MVFCFSHTHSPFDADLDANLNLYNGLAYNARVTVIDINRVANGANVVPPAGLDVNYFGTFKQTGAAVTCNAW